MDDLLEGETIVYQPENTKATTKEIQTESNNRIVAQQHEQVNGQANNQHAEVKHETDEELFNKIVEQAEYYFG